MTIWTPYWLLLCWAAGTVAVFFLLGRDDKETPEP